MAENRFHQGNRLKYLIDKSPLKQSEILNLTGTPKSSLYDLYKKENIDKGTIEKFCNVLNVDIRQFYPDIAYTGVADPTSEFLILKERVKALELILDDKNQIIEQQKEIIELLKNTQPKRK